VEKKITKLTAVFLIIILLLTGCWDAKDISDLNIASMVIFDKRGGEYYLYLEIANLVSSGSNQEQSKGPKSTFVSAHDVTMPEARESVERELDKEIYLSTIKTLVITSRAAETDLQEYLFRLRADPKYRQNLLLVTTGFEPEELMSVKPENNALIGFSIDDTLQALIDEGHVLKITTARCLQNLYIGSAFIIPSIGIKNDQIEIDGYSVVSENKCIGFIPFKETRAIVYMYGEDPKWFYTVPVDDNKYTIEVRIGKRKTEPHYSGGEISFDLSYEFKATVLYYKETGKKLDEDTRNKIASALKDIIIGEFKSVLMKSQKELKSDYLGFDHELRLKYPDLFKNLDWRSEFQNVKFNLDFSVDIQVSKAMNYDPS
jgi:Ger(x)C family germination protein